MQSLSISDVTIKTADTSSAFSLSFKEKIELAKLLDRLNISVIEVGELRSRKIDSLLVKSIASAVRQSAVAVPVTLEEDSVAATWAALKEARRPRLQLKAPMSPAQMEYFWHKKPAQVLQTISERIRACREVCGDVEFIADDACRSERGFLVQAVRAAIEAGATAVTLCDAAGLMFPEELGEFLTGIRAEVPELKSVRLGMLCSDALCMANACAMAAVRAGATEIKTIACSGAYPRLVEFAAVLGARGDSFGLKSDLKLTEIKRIASQIEWMCHTTRSQNSPFDSGVQETVGDFALSAHDDRTAVMKAVERIGYDLSEEDAAKVCEAFERIAQKKGTVSARELDTIVASVAMQVPPTYQLVNYVINCGNVISASAQLKLNKAGETLEGVCLGDGPIDAAFLAVEQIVGHHYELDDFQIQAVTEGREAMGETVVRLRSNGKLYSGRGISTDIVGASIHAYISALNKIVYEEAQA